MSTRRLKDKLNLDTIQPDTNSAKIVIKIGNKNKNVIKSFWFIALVCKNAITPVESVMVKELKLMNTES